MSADTPAVPAVAPTTVPSQREQDQLQALYEVLFERNPDGIVYADREGRVTHNPAALKLVGGTSSATTAG